MGATAQTAIESFKANIYNSRCAQALLCGIACHLAAYFVAILPLAAINTSFYSVASHWLALLHPTSWLYLLVIVGLTCAMGFIHAAWYSVKPMTFSSWLNYLAHLSSKHILGTIASHMVISAFLMRSYLGLFGSTEIANLFVPCQNDKDHKCINEKHLFLVCQAAFSSIFASVSYFCDNRNLVTFPVAQQPLSERLTNVLKGNLWMAMIENLQTMKWFYLFYFLHGNWLCGFFTNNIDVAREGVAVDSVFGLLSVTLFLNAFTLGTLSRFMFQMGLSIFETFQTEALTLEVKSTQEAASPMAMTAAMEATSCPLLQHLAFLDFSELARRGADRRAPAFSLSQPGGHPHTFNQLAASSLGQITSLTQRLETALAPPSDNNNSPSITTNKPDFTGLRDLTGGAPPRPAAAPKRSEVAVLLDRLRGWLERRPLLGALLTEWPDSRPAAALADGRPALWAVSGLSALGVASLTEDRYGVAQRHLGPLLRALLELAAVLERVRRLAGCAGRGGGGAPVPRLASGLRAATATALFRLTATFGPHLRSLGLSDKELARLEPYRLYTEG
ncbi:nucleoporin NDC1-like [Amphibalanus amphitrite]|uniref:nucleoporin NDC1-like n=1 Tax=Amphibalanus amphitrite TaxID=1232801 RepID=UPI001C9180FB|nr:nucleoporin NDC1-like [Amphibalanus amphitrite]